MRRIALVLALLAAATGVLLYTACEVTSASGEVIISPSSVTILKGNSVEFTASGGFEYRWWLKNEEWGVLSTRRGQATVYTSLYDPHESFSTAPAAGKDAAVQIIYAGSYIPASISTETGGTGGGTNATTADILQTGEAYITHLSRYHTETPTNM